MPCASAYVSSRNGPGASLRKRTPQLRHHRFLLSKNTSQLTGGRAQPRRNQNTLGQSLEHMVDLHEGQRSSF